MASQTPDSDTSSRARTLAAALSSLLALALLLGACGSGEDEIDPGNAEDAPDYTKMVEAAPPELAAIYDAEGGGLIDGGLEAYKAQIAALDGYPIVVNAWASWCGPCRVEFPFFQDLAAERGDEVAFLGIDVDDSEDAATTFLNTHPVPYGSISDPDKEIVNELGLGSFLPSTVFYNAEGEKTYSHAGPYDSAEDLAADIDKYAVGG